MFARMLTPRDLNRLHGVHPDLVKVIARAAELTDQTFTVLEGVRSLDRQRQLVERGASQTMNSRHIPANNGYGHAVDIAPVVNGQASWDWPLYHRLAKVVKQAAKECGVPIEWGGDWKKFKDGPHWQLPWTAYPGQGADHRIRDAKPITNKTSKRAAIETAAKVGTASGGVMGGIAAVTEGARTVSDARDAATGLLSGSNIVVLALILLAAIAIAAYVYTQSKDDAE